MSVATLIGFRTYAEARGYTAPALASDFDAGAALIRAQDYVDAEYVSKFTAACTPDHPSIETAVYEAALAELNAEGALLPFSFWNTIYTPNTQKVLTEVKGIKWTLVGGADGADSRAVPVSGRIEALLGHCVIQSNAVGFGIWAIN